MTKAELLAALDPYPDDAPVEYAGFPFLKHEVARVVSQFPDSTNFGVTTHVDAHGRLVIKAVLA